MVTVVPTLVLEIQLVLSVSVPSVVHSILVPISVEIVWIEVEPVSDAVLEVDKVDVSVSVIVVVDSKELGCEELKVDEAVEEVFGCFFLCLVVVAEEKMEVLDSSGSEVDDSSKMTEVTVEVVVSSLDDGSLRMEVVIVKVVVDSSDGGL